MAATGLFGRTAGMIDVAGCRMFCYLCMYLCVCVCVCVPGRWSRGEANTSTARPTIMWYNVMYISSIPMIPRNHHCNGFRVGTQRYTNTHYRVLYIHMPGQPYIHVPGRSCASFVNHKIRDLSRSRLHVVDAKPGFGQEHMHV